MLTRALFIVCLITSLCVTASGSRADLGTYLNINDFSNGLPVSEERVTVDNYVLAYINYTYNTSDGKVINFSAERAKYGEGKILNVQGILVHVTSEGNVNDHTACMPPLRGNKGQILPSTEPWIALVRRGECTFEDKVKHIWRYRAVGVIIYDEENSVILDKMKIVDKERNITAVFTHKWIGEEMAKIVDSGNRVIVSISEGQRIRPMPNINKTSVLFVSISFIVLMIISLVWLIFYYVQRFRYLQSKDKHSRHLCSVAKRIIAKIPTRNIKNDEKDFGNDCCPICIELYKVTDCIRILPCKHEFHKNCIDPWLLEHRTCPMCKLDVLKHYGFVFIGSQESILQLDLDMEIGNEGLQNRDNVWTSNNHHQSINISTSFFHLPSLRGVNNIIRSSSMEFLVVAEREIIPERSKSSMSCVNNSSDGYFIGQSSNMAKLEPNCKSNIYNSHILKKEECAKKNGKAVDYDFDASNRLLENKTSMDKVDQSIAEQYVCKKSLYDTEVESIEEVVKNEESRENRNVNSESDSNM